MKQNFKQIAFIGLILVTAILGPGVVSAQGINPAFNPNKLIDDKVFVDTQTFGGASGIQKFLESKGSVLANTSPDFLAKLKEPNAVILKQALEDPNASIGRVRTAAELIWDASQTAGLNPQVILVMLNKEQSLVTGRQNATPEQLQRALNFALGFACPDSGGCGELFSGFYFQLFGNLDSEGNRYLGATKSLAKSFTTPGGRGPTFNGVTSRIGDTITLDNTLGGYEGVQPQQSVTLTNAATAALYRYTPHVFNGNYNFWKFTNEWFRYPNGTLLRLGSDSQIYIIQNGQKLPVPAFVLQARGLSSAQVVTVSQAEFDSYTTDKPYGPADNTVIKVTGSDQTFVFIGNIRHPASAFVLSQRGLNAANALIITAEQAALFTAGPMLTPTDGTVLKAANDAAVYLVEKGTLKYFSAFTFGQRKIKNVQVVPPGEVETYPKAGFVPPLDSTLVMASGGRTIYVVEQGQKRGLTGELFRNRGYTYKQVAVLSKEEVDALPEGPIATPKDGTYFKVSATGRVYQYKQGAKHGISSFVAGQRQITPDYTFGSESDSWPDGAPIPPRDNTLIKGDASPTAYLVITGQLRPLTASGFQNRRLSWKNLKILPQAEVDAYAKGEIIN